MDPSQGHERVGAVERVTVSSRGPKDQGFVLLPTLPSRVSLRWPEGRHGLRRRCGFENDDGGMATGAEVSRAFYESAARPVVERVLADNGYLVARLGSGSDVLGLDDDRSQDHDFGCRLTVLVDEGHAPLLAELDRLLEEELPDEVAGWPTRFATSWDRRVRHKVDLHTVHDFAASRLGFDLRAPLTPVEWLCLTGQAVLEVTAGPVFHDSTSSYREVATTLKWYPSDIWRYVLAAGWTRLGQELPLIGRAGELGDELGSQVIAGRLCRDLIQLAFTVERTWAPYPKWSGGKLHRLPSGGRLAEVLAATLAARGWEERQRHLVEAVEEVAERHRTVGFDVPRPAVVPFFDRPFVMPTGEIAAALLRDIDDPDIRALPCVGAIEQWCDNVDLLSYPQRRARASVIYETP